MDACTAPSTSPGFFVGDNFERFATARFNDPRPWWFYLPIAAGGLLPWTPLALVWLGPIMQFLHAGGATSGRVDLRLLLWALLPLVFFTLSVGKQPRYILPVLPPLAILLASSVIERTSEWRSLDGARRRPRPNRAVVVGAVLSGLFLLALAALVYRARSLFLGVDVLNTLVVTGVIAMGGLAVIIVALSSAWRSAPGVLAFASALAFAVLPYGVFADAEDSSVTKMAAQMRALGGRQDVGIATYKVFVTNLVFYTGLKHTDIVHEDHLRQWLGQHPLALVVMSKVDAEHLTTTEGISLERLAELPYFNEGVIKLRVLLRPDPATDLETVVLVRVSRPPTIASRD